MPVKQLGRNQGFSDASVYKWRTQYGGMNASAVTRLKELDSENGKQKQLVLA